jgi:dephospho-CoA kinase
MLKIGITGGIGTGKTTVCKIFQLLGIPVYDADSRAKSLMSELPALKEALLLNFGEGVYKDGLLDNKYLSGIVFNNPEKLALLNSLVHPRVGDDFISWTNAQKNVPYVLKEAALMFEAGSDQSLDRVIVVSSPTALRIKRILIRDPQRSEQQVRAIMAQQMPEDEKMRKADMVIYNDDKHLLISQVIEIHKSLCKS